MIPTFFVIVILMISGLLKITGYHPMLPHFTEMGLHPYVKLLGTLEIAFALLFGLSKTSKLGLLLLTAYFGGAMAAEIPYHMLVAPFMPLALTWIAAFVRQPSLFIERKKIAQLS